LWKKKHAGLAPIYGLGHRKKKGILGKDRKESGKKKGVSFYQTLGEPFRKLLRNSFTRQKELRPKKSWGAVPRKNEEKQAGLKRENPAYCVRERGGLLGTPKKKGGTESQRSTVSANTSKKGKKGGKTAAQEKLTDHAAREITRAKP